MAVRWTVAVPATEEVPPDTYAAVGHGAPSTPPQSPGRSSAEPAIDVDRRIVIGGPSATGKDYQPRAEAEAALAAWEQGDLGIAWVHGPPGCGKTFLARRMWQTVLTEPSPRTPQTLIWVNAETADGITTAYARAFDRLHAVGHLQGEAHHAPDRTKAGALHQYLAETSRPWLVVLDNADPSLLRDTDLLPPPTGRVLATALTPPTGIAVDVQLPLGAYSDEESDAFVERRLPGVPPAARQRLGSELSGHPLALAVATATINEHAMTVDEWLGEYRCARLADSLTESDPGGYPHLFAAAWRAAMDRAARIGDGPAIHRAALLVALGAVEGQPSWMWAHDFLIRAMSAEIDHWPKTRIPPPLKALLDHGLVEVQGDSWRTGVVVMHQLAARAIVETSSAEQVNQTAKTLLDLWLLTISEPRDSPAHEVRRSHVARLAAHAALPEGMRRIAAHLRDHDMASSTWVQPELGATFQRSLDQLVHRIEQDLDSGPVGWNRLAERQEEAGDAWAARDEPARANVAWRRAEELNQETLQATRLPPEVSADALRLRARIDFRKGDLRGHADHLSRAAAEYEKALTDILRADNSGSARLRILRALVRIYSAMSDEAATARTRNRGLEALASSPVEPTPADSETTLDRVLALNQRARDLRAFGRVEEAIDIIQTIKGSTYEFVWFDTLIDMHIELGRTEEALRLLKDPATGIAGRRRTLQASLLLRVGRVDEVNAFLRAQAQAPTEVELDPECIGQELEGDDNLIWERYADLLLADHRSELSNLTTFCLRLRLVDEAFALMYAEQRTLEEPDEDEDPRNRDLALAKHLLLIGRLASLERPSQAIGPTERAKELFASLRDLGDSPSADIGWHLAEVLLIQSMVQGDHDATQLHERAMRVSDSFDGVLPDLREPQLGEAIGVVSAASQIAVRTTNYEVGRRLQALHVELLRLRCSRDPAEPRWGLVQGLVRLAMLEHQAGSTVLDWVDEARSVSEVETESGVEAEDRQEVLGLLALLEMWTNPERSTGVAAAAEAATHAQLAVDADPSNIEKRSTLALNLAATTEWLLDQDEPDLAAAHVRRCVTEYALLHDLGQRIEPFAKSALLSFAHRLATAGLPDAAEHVEHILERLSDDPE